MSRLKVFVVGVGRSGTSLIQSMLAAHSRLAFPPETSFIRRYIADKRLESIWNKGGRKALDKTISEDPKLQRLSVDFAPLVEVFGNYQPGRRDMMFYEAILDATAEEQNKLWAGDKDPKSIELLPVIHNYWPQTHIVHIIRDPRDVLVSKNKAKWAASRQNWQHIFANRIQLKLGRHEGRKFFGELYHEIRYSDLLQNPEETLHRLCDKLDIEYEPAMLDFSETAKQLVSKEEESWKKETMGPLLKSNPGKWKSELKSAETALTELVCREGIEHSGSNISGAINKLSIISKVRVYLTGGLIMASTLLYRVYRNFKLSM